LAAQFDHEGTIMSQSADEHVGDQGWGMWGAVSALILATVLALATFVLTSSGEAVETADNEVTQAAPTTTLAPAPTEAPSTPGPVARGEDDGDGVREEPLNQGDTAAAVDLPSAPAALGGEEAAGFDSARSTALAAATQITNMGPTEVGFTTNFPTVDYTWERIEVQGPGLTHEGWLGILGEQLVAITPGLHGGQYGPGGQSLTTNVSADGITWDQVGRYEIPEGMWIHRVVSDGNRVFAFAQADNPALEDAGISALVSADGIGWSMIPVPIALEGDEHVYVQNSAAGPAGVVVALNVEVYPEEPPRTLVFDDYEVTLDYMRSSYVLTDGATGEQLLSGKLDDLFNWGGEGQRVWNVETGEIITTVPWEFWERAWGGHYGGGSPLPLPIHQPEAVEGPVLTVEYDGYVITVDERAGTFTVADAETGEEITSGTVDELYQGPAPTFRDPESGEVYLTVTWDEWYRAEERSWQDVEYPEGDYYYRSKTALVTSSDGENWSVEYATEAQGGHVSFIAPTADGFIARVRTYDDFGERTSLWTYANGSWSSTETDRMDLWLNTVVPTESGLIGVGEGSGGPALWRSGDGISWSTEFSIVPQDDGSHAWMSSVAADEAGTVGALVTKQRWNDEYRPLVIEQDQYTATFEGDSLLEVVDTGSGELVLSLTWRDFEEGDAADLITWEDGVTTIVLGNGEVMAIPDEEAYAAMDQLYRGSSEMGISVFLNSGTGWVETVVDAEGGISGASQLLLADGKVFIGGNYWGDSNYGEFGPADDTFVLLVGTPAGG
jgi:hypothetical protein